MKKIKYLLAVVLALGLVLGLCACGEGSDNTTDPADTGTEAAASTGSTEESKAEPTYTVKVVDEGNNPIVGAVVQLCEGSNCNPTATNEEGVAEYFLDKGDYKVSFVVMPSGYTYSGEETEFHFADGETSLTITLKAVG